MSVTQQLGFSVLRRQVHCIGHLHITYMGFTEGRVAARLLAGVTIGKRGVVAVPNGLHADAGIH
jgi:hypothetical protein